ncbi:MAG: DUF4172 domain-containing protein [Spirochaetaceae bacterium]|jgi:Fic family protein|nr:DUF4172 domain-containing protein [Spirochaetaceae bacterium]
MKEYLWQKPDWQEMKIDYGDGKLAELLAEARFAQGQVLGKIASLDLHAQLEAESRVLISEALQTSRIEGVELNVDSVRSSVATRLGLPEGLGYEQKRHHDRHSEGVVDILLDAVQNHDAALTENRLHGWHAALFPTGYSGIHKIDVACFRKGTMHVVSGNMKEETVHFEAPPPEKVAAEMAAFLRWFNGSLRTLDGLVRAAQAHLKFVTIHPYDDGNGRLSRAITDMACSQDEGLPYRAYSLSLEIMNQRQGYYQILEAVQNGSASLSDWFRWFLRMYTQAIANTETIIEDAFFKAAFWNQHKGKPLNERQQKVVARMLEAGKAGFEGGMTTRKYSSLAKTSKATAYRELEDLCQKEMLQSQGAGRSVHYALAS